MLVFKTLSKYQLTIFNKLLNKLVMNNLWLMQQSPILCTQKHNRNKIVHSNMVTQEKLME